MKEGEGEKKVRGEKLKEERKGGKKRGVERKRGDGPIPWGVVALYLRNEIIVKKKHYWTR